MSEDYRVDVNRLGCSTIAFRHFSLQIALEAIESLGFEYVDIGTMPGFCPHFNFFEATEEEEEAFIECVSSSPLKLHTFTTSVGHFNAPDADWERFHVAAQRNLRVAHQLGAMGVNLNCGQYLDRSLHLFEDDVKKVGQNIHLIAKEANELGLQILIEAPHKGNLIRTAEEALQLLEECNHSNIHLIFDCNHHHAAGWGMNEAVRAVGEHIGLIHLRDAVGRENRYPLGAGEINFKEMFQALHDINYDGLYSFEFTDAGKTVEDNKEMLRQSIAYLK